MKIRIRDLALASVIGAALAAPAYAQAEDDGNYGLEEIIVTAQKREQSVQDVPIAVTAVTQDALQANRIMTVNDLSSIAPGLIVKPSAGGIQVPVFTIRGEQSSGVVAGSDKQVSIYLDGVYLSSPRGSIFDLPDIARLEVLRGPQGTLFGRNATGGAISVVTRDPTGEAHIKARAGIANRDGYNFRITADTPQIGPISALFSFQRTFQRGEVRNAAGGTPWDRSLALVPGFGVTRASDWLGTVDSNSYFAAVKADVSDTFKIVYKYDRNEDNGSSDAVSIVGYDPTFAQFGTAAGLFAPIINALYGSNNIYLNPGNTRPDVVSNSWSVPRQQVVFGHSVTSTWEATDNITVKNIFAYRNSYVQTASAIDGVSGLTFTPQALVPYATFLAFSSIGRVPGINTPADAIAFIPTMVAANSGAVGGRYMLTASQATSRARQWSDEVQVNYRSENLNVTVGGIWFRSRDVSGGPAGIQNTLAFSVIPASGLLPLGQEGRSFNQATSIAGYGQIEYKFTPQLEVVLGARVTHDKKTGQFRYSSRGPAVVTNFLVQPDYSATKPSFLVGLNWRPNDDTMVYGKWSSSYVSGGNFNAIPYAPETASSFEVGLKADFLDRRLRTNIAIYHVDYKHFQQPSSPTSVQATQIVRSQLLAAFSPAVVDQLVPLAGGGAVSTYVQDTGNMRVKGFEAEITALPMRGLTLGGSAGYTDANWTYVDPVVLAGYNGEYIPTNRPKWTLSLFGQYETQPLVGETTLQLRLDGFYRSTYVLTNSPVRDALDPGKAPFLYTPGHWKLNGRIALRNLQIGPFGAELALWGRNLTNKGYANSTLYLRQGTASNFDQGRALGADLSVEF